MERMPSIVFGAMDWAEDDDQLTNATKADDSDEDQHAEGQSEPQIPSAPEAPAPDENEIKVPEAEIVKPPRPKAPRRNGPPALSCSCCLHPFLVPSNDDIAFAGDEAISAPVLLLCGHTFCYGCLEALPKEHAAVNPRSDVAETGYENTVLFIRCIQCSQQTPLGARGLTDLPLNRAVIDVIEGRFMNLKTTEQGKAVVEQKSCEECQERVATIICEGCNGVVFCQICSDEAHRTRVMQRHTRKPLVSEGDENNANHCKTHNEILNLFCLHCEIPICVLCKDFGDCAGHQTQPFEETVTDAKRRIQEKAEALQAFAQELHTASTTMCDAVQGVEAIAVDAHDAIVEQFDKLINVLKGRRELLLYEVERVKVDKTRTLQSQRSQLAHAIASIGAIQAAADKVLSLQGTSLLSLKDDILKDLSAVDASSRTFPTVPAVTPTIFPRFVNTLFHAIDHYGFVSGTSTPLIKTGISAPTSIKISWELLDDHKSMSEEENKTGQMPVAYLLEMSKPDVKDAEGDFAEPGEAGHIEVYKPNLQLHDPSFTVVYNGNETQAEVKDLLPSSRYAFRVRAMYDNGLGPWSPTKTFATSHNEPVFQMEFRYSGTTVQYSVPQTGRYRIIARGAKAADGQYRKGGRGAIVQADFNLEYEQKLDILCGGMSTRHADDPNSGGGGGTFVSINNKQTPLIVAGGGGGTRGTKDFSYDGLDANLDPSGAGHDGLADNPHYRGEGGKDGNAGGAPSDLSFGGAGGGYKGPAGKSWRGDGAICFVGGGAPGQNGGFGGGGSSGKFGGGGGGGYSGGGGGWAGGGGGSFINQMAFNQARQLGCEGNGSVTLLFLGK